MLRPYQHELLASVKEQRAAGVNRQLATLPTGMGKTVCFSKMPEELNIVERMMVEVHRDELAEQAADKIQKWNPHLKVEIEMGEREATRNADIVVAGVQTAYSRDFKRLKRLNEMFKFDLLVPDEAHHYIADKFQQTLEITMNNNPNCLLVGYTATPNRSDKAAMGQVFNKIVYQYSMLRGIREGWLADLHGVRIRTETDISKVRDSMGDFAQGELSRKVNVKERNAMIVQHWLNQAQDRQTVAFCVDVEHSKELALEFQRYGVAAEAVWGGDPYRKEKLRMHRAGQLRVLTNYGILTEGYDDWRIGCIIMARPTKSQLVYVQCAGRGARIPDELGAIGLVEARRQGLPIEKDSCLLLDVSDVTGKLSLMTINSILGLPANMEVDGSATELAEEVEEVRGKIVKAGLGEELDKVSNREELHVVVEKADLWSMKFAEEILSNTELQWMKMSDGHYTLKLPNRERLNIYRYLDDAENEKWEVTGTIKGDAIDSRDFDDFQAALLYTEMNLSLRGQDYIDALRRKPKNAWKAEGATEKQLAALKRMRIAHGPSLTKGEATALLMRRLKGRGRFAKRA